MRWPGEWGNCKNIPEFQDLAAIIYWLTPALHMIFVQECSCQLVDNKVVRFWHHGLQSKIANFTIALIGFSLGTSFDTVNVTAFDVCGYKNILNFICDTGNYFWPIQTNPVFYNGG